MATKSKAKAKKITVYRSSDTGKFVSTAYAKKHPKTTFKQIGRRPNRQEEITARAGRRPDIKHPLHAGS